MQTYRGLGRCELPTVDNTVVYNMSDKEELCAECRVGNDGWEEGWVQKRSREFG